MLFFIGLAYFLAITITNGGFCPTNTRWYFPWHWPCIIMGYWGENMISTRKQIRLNMAITESEKRICALKHPESFKEIVKKRYTLYTEIFKEVFGKQADEGH